MTKHEREISIQRLTEYDLLWIDDMSRKDTKSYIKHLIEDLYSNFDDEELDKRIQDLNNWEEDYVD
jgi:hypothetical protein